jgi:hypothetical protein
MRLAPSDLNGGSGGVNRSDTHTSLCEQAGEGPGSASDIEYGASAELVCQDEVCVEISSIGMEPIVEFGKTSVLE